MSRTSCLWLALSHLNRSSLVATRGLGLLLYLSTRMTEHDSGPAGPSSAPLSPLEPTQTTERSSSRPEPQRQQQAAASTSKLNPHSASFSFSFLQPDQVPSTSAAAYPPTASNYHSYPAHQLDQQQPPHYPYPPLLQGYSQPQPYPIDLHQQFQWAQGPAKGVRGAAQGRWQQQSYYPPPPPLQHAPPPQRPPLHPSHSAQNGIYLPLPNGPPLSGPSHLTSPSLQPALLPAFTLQPSSHPINSAFSAPPNQQQTVTATPRLPGLSHPPSANAHSQQPHRARRARPPPPALAPALSLGPNVRPPPEYKSRFPTAVPVQPATAAKKDEAAAAKDQTSARSTSATGRTTPTVSTATAQTSPTSTSTPALLSPTTTTETSVLEDSTVESNGGGEQVTPVEEKEEKVVTPVEEKTEPSVAQSTPAAVEAPSTPAPAPKPSAPTPAAAEPVAAPSTPSTSTPSALHVTTSTSTPAPAPTTPSAAPSTPKSPPPSVWGASGPKKSWADLLRSPGSSVPPPLLPNGQPATAIKEHVPPKPISRKTLAETLAGLDLTSATKDGHVVTPRGLVNNGNLCFANAILQVLVYCAPFWRLLEGVRREVKGGQMSVGGLGAQVGSLEAM